MAHGVRKNYQTGASKNNILTLRFEPYALSLYFILPPLSSWSWR
jgi:hypothetical protein